MSYNVKNYTEQGGDVTHFGGKVVFEEGSQVEGLPTPTVPVASTQTLGGVKIGSGLSITEEGVLSAGTPSIPDAGLETKGLVKQGVAVANCEGSYPSAQDFNSLLISLRAAGIIAVEA